jgi:hypothetical protein
MHFIRLRGPWQLEPVARFVLQSDGGYVAVTDDLPLAATMTMPADWSAAFGGEFLGRVRYHRNFNTPTGLDEGQRVFLVVDSPRSRGVVALQDKRLGEVAWGGPPGRFEITGLLKIHNRLEIVLDHPPLDAANSAIDDGSTRPPGGMVGEVWLEIEE